MVGLQLYYERIDCGESNKSILIEIPKNLLD